MKAKLQRLIAHLRAEFARLRDQPERLEVWRLLAAAERIHAKLEGGKP